MSRKVKIYVAGASREIPRVLEAVKWLDKYGGFEVTGRWWEAVEVNGGPGNDHALTREQRDDHAVADLSAVSSAEIVWGLWPTARHSEGMPLEVGYALALRDTGSSSVAQVVVSGQRANECIFGARADVEDASDLVAFHAVCAIAAGLSTEVEVNFEPVQQYPKRVTPYPEARREAVGDFERRYVRSLLRTTNGNVSEAARIGKLDRVYLHRMMRKHDLHRDEFDRVSP